MEVHQLSITTDCKPITFVLLTKSGNLTPCQTHHSDYIAQFTTDTHQMHQRIKQPVADVLYHTKAS